MHEASHAVATRAIGQAVSAQKISIVARGRNLGSAAHMLVDRDQVILQEATCAGSSSRSWPARRARRSTTATLSTGVEGDLDRASKLARSMVASYGMSDEFGPVSIGEKAGEVFLGASLQELGSVGPVELELIDREVERFVTESLETATVVLERNWHTVQETAAALLEHETLSGVALEAVLSTVQFMPLEKPSGSDVSTPRQPNEPS